MIGEGALNPREFYSHVVPYTKIREAMRLLESREAFKVVLSFDEIAEH